MVDWKSIIFLIIINRFLPMKPMKPDQMKMVLNTITIIYSRLNQSIMYQEFQEKYKDYTHKHHH